MSIRSRRFIQSSTAVIGAASLAVLGQAAVLAATAPLSAGGTVEVLLDQPLSGTVPFGADVPIAGTARVDASPTPTRTTALVYTLDVSGSTTAPVTGGVSNCGEQDGLSPIGSILDCQIASLVRLNDSAIEGNGIGEVGAVAFAGLGTAFGGTGRDDAVLGDVDPSPAVTGVFTEPATATGSTVPDIVRVLRSASNVSSPGFGLRQFTPRFAPGAGTNYEAAVLRSVEAATTSVLPSKLVVMVSDGVANQGVRNLPSPASATTGQFPNASSFRSWVASVAGGARFITIAVGGSVGCGSSTSTSPTFGTLQAIADATGGICRPISNPAALPDVLPNVIETVLEGVSATVDGAGLGVTSVGDLPAQPGTTIPFSATVSGLEPGSHQICGLATGRDSGGPATARECRTVDVAAVTLPPTVGGTAADVEGAAVPISAQVNGSATFVGWSAFPAGTDPGATCAFADASATDTTVTCTDDGSFLLTATTDPADSRRTTLRLGNVAPDALTPSFTTPGPVFVGSTVEVVGRFTDDGRNDSHTCTVDIGDGPINGFVVEPSGPATGFCTASVVVSSPGTVSASMLVRDDDGGEDSAVTATGAELEVVDLVIAGGDQPGGGFSGVEGSPVNPTVDVPAGTTLTWSVTPIAPLDAGATCALTDETTASPTLLCDDDGDLRLTVSAVLNGERREARLPVRIANADPELAVPSFDVSGVVLPGTPVTVSAPFTDAGANDSHTCEALWSDGVTSPGSVFGGLCRSTRALPESFDAFSASLTVTDDDAGFDTRSTTENAAGGTITVTVVEIATPEGGTFTTTEGSPVTASATVPSTATLSWTAEPVSADPGADCLVLEGDTATPRFVCDDDGTFRLTVTATLGGRSQSAVAPLRVDNANPTITAVALSSTLVAVGSPVTLTASYGDAGTNDTHTCVVDWGDGSLPQSGTASAGQCTVTRPAPTVGVNQVTVTVTDDDDGLDTATTDFLVVYDPTGGFVTGGGHIPVPAGSLSTDPAASGRASFGFNSKYHKGASKPSGNTEFQFHAGAVNFQSTDYQWLVVSGAKAQYRGTGTVNGVAGYEFLVTAYDGQARGASSTADAFRIKIWDSAGTLFDNRRGTSDDFSSSTGQALSGGSIVIHAAK